MKNRIYLLTLFLSGIITVASAQELREYQVNKTATPLSIDGKLTEVEWLAAADTEIFVEPETGGERSLSTKAKMLWDENYLYVGFICEDRDVWSSLEERDDPLWDEENVEIFCDPNGDKYDYIELEFNPLGTIFDQLVDRSWIEGSNNEDRGWNLEGLLAAVSVNGTINEPGDTDSSWTCEIALPFEALASITSPLSTPPIAGEEWRIQLARYERQRNSEGEFLNPGKPELSIWNPTGSQNFHVPDKFGRIIFSDLALGSNTNQLQVMGIAPNPCSSYSNIRFEQLKGGVLKLEILDALGRVVEKPYDQYTPEGFHTIIWDASLHNPGMYFLKLSSGKTCVIDKVMRIQ